MHKRIQRNDERARRVIKGKGAELLASLSVSSLSHILALPYVAYASVSTLASLPLLGPIPEC